MNNLALMRYYQILILTQTENGTSISPAIIPYEGTDGSAKSARDSSSLNIHRVSLTKPRRRVMSASAPSYWSNTISTVFSSVDYDTDGTDDSDDPDDVDNPPPLTSLHQVRNSFSAYWEGQGFIKF